MASIRATGLALALATLACGAAMAAENPVAGKPAPEAATRPDPFRDAPPELRAFFTAAERADAIADPLQRCLAYPDLPGNRWPEGLAKAHCALRYTPRITLAEMKGFIERGAFAELDARFAADLARHYDDSNFSEVIHRDFDDIDSGYESGRLTQRWLDAAPQSPWALATRAVHYYEKGSAARGGKFAGETPDENFVRMREFDGLALDHYERALAIEPRLMPALIGLMKLANRSSHRVLERDAMARAMKLDPGCASIARVTMNGLQPRWGGSYGEMAAYAEELRKHAARRPLVAIYIPSAEMDAADIIMRAKNYALLVELLAPVVAVTTDSDAHENYAEGLRHTDPRANRYAVLAHMLTAGRFTEGNAWANRARGRYLMQMLQPAWALGYLQRAAAEKPGDADGEYLLAGALSRVGRHAESEAHYKLAMADPRMHQKALEDVGRAMLLGKSVDKAVAYFKQYTSKYPDHAEMWRLQGIGLAMRGTSTMAEAREVIAAWRKFVALTESSPDPRVLQLRTEVLEDIAEMERVVLPKMRK